MKWSYRPVLRETWLRSTEYGPDWMVFETDQYGQSLVAQETLTQLLKTAGWKKVHAHEVPAT